MCFAFVVAVFQRGSHCLWCFNLHITIMNLYNQISLVRLFSHISLSCERRNPIWYARERETFCKPPPEAQPVACAKAWVNKQNLNTCCCYFEIENCRSFERPRLQTLHRWIYSSWHGLTEIEVVKYHISLYV